MRSFFSFVVDHEPRVASSVRRSIARAVQGKRRRRRATWTPRRCRLSSRSLIATVEGQRDHALLSLLYNTGARIQEALDLRPQDVYFKSPAHVRSGKGPKGAHLAHLAGNRRSGNGDPATAAETRRADFRESIRSPLTASGFRFRLRQYVEAAAKAVPTISRKRVTPHVFRHSTAVHLVAAGVDVTVIRSWLGHAQLDTTNHYAQANLETKRKALEQVDPKLRPARPPRWKRDADLLAWLDSL